MFLQNWHLHSEKGIEGFGIEPQAGSGNGVLFLSLFSFSFFFLVGIDHETPAIQYWDKVMLYNNMTPISRFLKEKFMALHVLIFSSSFNIQPCVNLFFFNYFLFVFSFLILLL